MNPLITGDFFLEGGVGAIRPVISIEAAMYELGYPERVAVCPIVIPVSQLRADKAVLIPAAFES